MTDFNKTVGGSLYDLLPRIYKVEDSQVAPTPYPLQRFLQVAQTGFDFLEGKIDDHMNLYNVVSAPSIVLPHLARMMGFIFPYDMTEQEQRSLIKLLPTLYKLKGTKQVFEYLAQLIYSQDATTDVTWSNMILDASGNVTQKNRINLVLTVDGNIIDLNSKLDKYNKYADEFRPINHELYAIVNLYYSDVYSRQPTESSDFLMIDDDAWNYDGLHSNQLLNHLILNSTAGIFPDLAEQYVSVEKVVDISTDQLLDTGDDLYNVTIQDDFGIDVVNSTDSETYTRLQSDVVTDVGYDLSNALNNTINKLNAMKLSQPLPISYSYTG